MKIGIRESAVLLGAVAAAYVVYRGYKFGGGAVQAVKDSAEKVQAVAINAWRENISAPFQRGQDYANGVTVQGGDPVRAALYSNAGYAGLDDQTGMPVDSGQWYLNPDALRYDNAQRDNGTPPAATSIDGAAFGVYASPFGSKIDKNFGIIDAANW